ncbi:Zn(II)2Cys6 transcription factor [Aspergillus candidus]|uniref:Fungal-specific transcription factor domain-domain-containing protein n=1 Tax=Aspergillus candidus TaxID=41067 RepID=A0A2I2F8E6_ASPCN|nr:fungal-specific transcription factor domain-domain-containing protein [Aspergillus candidus]PLB36902.1 fungal-specific transcription factor domain-domain-containing protein [Aspergillus candidus]
MVDISAKRRKLDPPDPALNQPSAFRNVSSCRRCRLRKGRCDQRLPRCRPCEKVGARCISYDPITRREFPRSYVYFLETRIAYLQSVLVRHDVPFEPEAAFDEKQIVITTLPATEAQPVFDSDAENTSNIEPSAVEQPVDKDNNNSHSSGNNILRSATTNTDSALLESIPSNRALSPTRSSLPDRDLADRLVQLYFEHANPQLPVLHRGEFTDLIAATYATPDTARPQRTLFFLFIVFAIGAGIVFEDRREDANERAKPTKSQPEAYHATAISHLHSSSSSITDFTRLESLQAVILLAHFALLRPVAPGPAHTAGLALRTAIDMGLYMDRHDDPHPTTSKAVAKSAKSTCWTPLDQRRRLWWCVYSLDRLIAPCTGRPFGIADQVISTGFPAIPADQAIRQAGCVPCSKYIARHYFQLRVLQSEVHEGVLGYCAARGRDSSSFSASSSSSAAAASSGDVAAAAASFPSPPTGDDSDSHRTNAARFLKKLGVRSFSEWVGNVRTRLDAWRARVPVVRRPGAWFPAALLELDYWLTVNLLYRGSVRVPGGLAWDSDLGFGLGLGGRPRVDENGDESEDEGDENVSIEVAEASQKVLQIYRMMHHVRLVNYTYLATHSIFMAGSFFLFTIWNSPLVRSRLTLDEIDYTLLAGTSVLTDMIDKYPHAEACRDALARMGVATVQMCLSTGGFRTDSVQDEGGKAPTLSREGRLLNGDGDSSRRQVGRDSGSGSVSPVGMACAGLVGVGQGGDGQGDGVSPLNLDFLDLDLDLDVDVDVDLDMGVGFGGAGPVSWVVDGMEGEGGIESSLLGGATSRD